MNYAQIPPGLSFLHSPPCYCTDSSTLPRGIYPARDAGLSMTRFLISVPAQARAGFVEKSVWSTGFPIASLRSEEHFMNESV